jgi:hypothetical protein
MDRREMLGALGGGAAVLLATGQNAGAQEVGRFKYRSQLDKMHVDCLDACTACSAVCNEASQHCLLELQKGSEHREHHARSHHLAMDCALMCSTSATLIARQSPLMAAQCNACAEACRQCGDECEKIQNVAEIMRECTRICRECERTCREMARAMGARSSGTR